METSEEPVEDGGEEAVTWEAALCPTCFHHVNEDWDFCPHCNAPLGATVGLDPLNRVYTLRFLIYQGTQRPNRPIILLGMWAIYVTFLGPFPYLALTAWSFWDIVLGAFFITLMTPIAVWTLYLVTRNALRIRSIPETSETES